MSGCDYCSNIGWISAPQRLKALRFKPTWKEPSGFIYEGRPVKWARESPLHELVEYSDDSVSRCPCSL